uniref:Sacchrp_dh_NADP domain-containing protein n=1 Tax=Angiostrongylus cantonensis TaxID=6313 RepID=A0A0K0DHL2_ANGCA
MVVTCEGPDAGYMATSACALSAALALIHSENLPEGGGVFTSASAFARTEIYSYLESFGIVFKVDTPTEPI